MGRYDWIDGYCVSKKGVVKDHKPEWDAVRYRVGDKMFAMQGGDKEGHPIITIKLEPTLGALLRSRYSDIVPGYYMNKEHWNSLYLEGTVPDGTVREMLDNAYAIVFASLSGKVRRELEEGNREK
ncbi:MmcQ/YjbR family DNA-binding protein [Caproiciproducens sp. R1]|uniref:MmcQ/YjbR family DNA-binding protein n=1 Tax=Caproiciproducens sp. R1 TaxID=3435000 RepID=UPI004033E7BE